MNLCVPHINTKLSRHSDLSRLRYLQLVLRESDSRENSRFTSGPRSLRPVSMVPPRRLDVLALLPHFVGLLVSQLRVVSADILCVASPTAIHVSVLFQQGCCRGQVCDRPATIQNAITGAQAADTVLVFAGTYYGPVSAYNPAGNDAQGNPSGSCANGVCDQVAWWAGSLPTKPNPVRFGRGRVHASLPSHHLRQKLNQL